MKPKTLALLAVAGGCGLVAMLGVQQAMQGRQAAPRAETKKVLVALENIDTGVKITDENTSFREMQKDLIPEGAITKEEDFKERAAKVSLFANDIVTKSKLTEQGVSGTSVLIPKGMRVIAINVDDTHTNSGLLAPGDRVDVLVTYRSIERNGQVTKTKTLLEYVEVFAADNHTTSKMEQDKNGGKAKTVSLLLHPDQVSYVYLASQKGTLQLAWRHKNDDELAQTKEVDDKLLEELQGTVGINDPLPMNAFDSELGHHQPVEEAPQQSVAASNAASFLDQQAASAPAGAPLQPAKPMWTMTIYNGASPMEHQFEIPEPAANPAIVPGEIPQVEIPKDAGNVLKDLFKSALGPGKSSGQKSPALVPGL